MRRYEIFNPAIPEEPEKVQSTDLPEYEQVSESLQSKDSKGKTSRGRKVANTTRSKPKVKKESGERGKKIIGFFTSRTLRWLVGLFLALFAVYLGIAFLSYFSTCINDQSEINNTAIGYSSNVANAAGEGGARLSEFLINEFFGIGSFVLIIWLIAVGLRLLSGHPKFKFVNFTIKCIVALITVSLIVGLLTIGMQSNVNWGGYHGRYVNEFIIHFVGWTGAVMLGIFMVGCFVLISMRDVVKWGIKQKAKIDEKRRLRKEQQEEERAKERELEEMRQHEDLVAKEEEEKQETDDETLPEEEELSTFEVRFGEEDQGLYSEIRDYEEYVYTEDLQQENVTQEDQTSETSIIIYENKEEDQTFTPTHSLIGETGSSYDENNPENLTADKIEEKEPESEELSEEKEEAGGVELNMVVNVNSISQVKGKSNGVAVDSPEKFPYKFPSFDLMAPGKSSISVDAEEQLANKEQIRRTLLDFDIPIVSIEATVGPTVTLYEIVPDKGIRVSKIRSLVDDIALSLSAEQGVRIIAPIPGKGTVGIEVANKDKQTVSMQTVLKSPSFQETKYKLPVALGSTISNDVFVADLAKMPHLLVAGATGQGKSVGLNAIITSLLYSKRPDELKFVMIDPKMVEFSLYAKIEGHYLAKIPDAEDAIITDMDKVKATLNSLCIEMDNRYQLLKEASTRNIIEYNEKIKEKRLNPNDGHRFLPYIVVIVDEFSDLIMTAGKEVEVPIARLAQKARAVGMHVIIATQRPSTNVITGIIKANFPARIAFKVSSGVDSKTILDTTGAQQLIGRGDMLVSNSAPMVRVQCAFIDTPEVEKICEHISRQPYQQGAYILPEPLESNSEGGGDMSGSLSERDPLFEEVARLVVQSNNASTSSLQRRYSIGYNRAGKIMDQLEAAGIVGPAQGGKPRSVLTDPMGLEHLLQNM